MPKKHKGSYYDEAGHFHPDPTPIEVPLSMREHESESVRIAQAVRKELDQRLEANEQENFEEQMDFDVEEDEDIFPMSDYELVEMQEEYLDEPANIQSQNQQEESENGEKEVEKQTEKNERGTPQDTANDEGVAS